MAQVISWRIMCQEATAIETLEVYPDGTVWDETFFVRRLPREIGGAQTYELMNILVQRGMK